MGGRRRPGTLSHMSATAAFVVDLSNGRRTADVDSPYGGGVVVTPAILFGDFYNALDLCDSYWRNGAAGRSKLPVIAAGSQLEGVRHGRGLGRSSAGIVK
jgi:hypothetical protein